MTQQEIAIQIAAELAAEEGRPLHLPDVMPNGFGPLYLVAAARLIQKRNKPDHKCADCGKPIDVAKDKYWASTNLICDPCWQSYSVCEDLDEVSHA